MPIRGVDLVYLAMEGADYLVPDQMNYAMKRVPQLGFQYLCASLKAGGYTSNILDQPILGFDPPALLVGLNRNPDRAVGFYCDSFLKPKVIKWIERLRELGFDRPILIGGPGSFGAKQYLEAGADFVVHGEGEKSILEILEFVNGRRTGSQLKGVSFVQNQQLVDSAPQDLIQNLDDLPFPDRDEYPIESYYDFHMFPMRVPFASMLTSRGCPYRCTFCSSPALWGRKVRQRSADSCLAEIDLLLKQYNARFVGFKDDVFALKRSWVDAFTQGMIDRNSGLTYSCNIHPFSFKGRKEQTIGLLAQSGCRLMVAGLQSADPQVLKNINRSPDEPEQLLDLVRIIKKNNIAMVVEFIFGLPGDTKKSWEKAQQWAKRARPHYALFYSLSKLEGSVIEKEYESKPVTSFSDDQIRQACADAQRNFFTSFRTIFRDIAFVIRRNPRWFLYVLKNIRYLISSVGIRSRPPKIESREI